MRLTVLIGLVIGLISLGVTAAAGGGCAPDDSIHSRGAGTSVEIKGCKFAPVVLFAPVGATVTWTNRENHPPHNIHGLGWGMSAGATINNGNETRATFDEPGIYPYQCSLHPGMNGVVVVGDGQVAAPAPDETALVASRTTPSDSGGILLGLASAVALALTAVGAYRAGRRRSS